ncbi:hypothetical protein ABT341_24920, partial [Pseudonocardia alni]|uniref:hypothetical protein n=1 Tax=Pseudonocardia alni TaxID=33907 RepID=UPI003328DE8D
GPAAASGRVEMQLSGSRGSSGIALAAALGAGAVWAVVLRRRGRLHGLGVYDETVASDVWGRAR